MIDRQIEAVRTAVPQRTLVDRNKSSVVTEFEDSASEISNVQIVRRLKADPSGTAERPAGLSS